MSINALDPLSDRVYITASELLKEKKEITVNDLLDVTDFCESIVRSRLDLLVKFNKLGVAKGTGRRPSYYFLPSEDQIALANLNLVDASFDRTFYQIQSMLTALKQQKSKLLTTLNAFEELRQSQDKQIEDIKSLISQNEDALSKIKKLLEVVT
jgi:hypothetical protein